MHRPAAKLRIERLEDRNLLTPWPFAPVNQSHPVGTTYGQYMEGGALGTHLHEGVDISVAADALAVEAGQIVNVWAGGPDPYQGVVIMKTGATTGWNYLHVEPGKKPAANAPALPAPRLWKTNDEVKVGDVMGRVVAAPFGFTHLHLDRGGDKDPSMDGYPQLEQKDLRRPVDDPLNHLVPLDDTLKPVVSKEFHFRVGEHDRNGTTALGTNVYVGQAEAPRNDNQYFDRVRN